MIITNKLRLCLLLTLSLFVAGAIIGGEAFALACNWTGGNADWDAATGNWSCGVIPDADDTATINLAVTVTLAATTTVGTLTIGGTFNATLDLQGNDLNVVNDLTVGTNGTLDASTGTPTITVTGNWTSGASGFTYGTSTVVFNGASQDVDCRDFYNLTITGSTVTIQRTTRIIGGTFTNNGILTDGAAAHTFVVTSDGTIAAPGPSSANLTVATVRFYRNATIPAGDYSGSANLDLISEEPPGPSNFTYTLTGDLTAAALTVRDYIGNVFCVLDTGAGSNAVTATGLTLNSGKFFANGSTVDINGNVTFTFALDEIDAGTSTWTVSGNWDSDPGTLGAGTSTITFDGTGTQDVWSGGSNFYTIEITNSSNTVTFTDDLTATNFTSNTGSVDMEFTAGSNYIITNLTLNGAQSNLITLDSTSFTHTPADQWNLNVSGSQSLSYVDVSDSDASSGPTIYCTTGCIEPNGNNENWIIQLISIPTMTEWGMIIFMVLTGLVSIYYLRRRRTTP